MRIENLLRDKVYIEEEAHEIYKKLKEELKLFDTMKDVFLVAASLGFYMNKKKPIEKKKDIFIKHVFNKEIDIPFIGIIALSDTHDKNIFERDLLEIVEQYANAGIWELNEIIKNAKNKKEAIDEMSIFLMEKFG